MEIPWLSPMGTRDDKKLTIEPSPCQPLCQPSVCVECGGEGLLRYFINTFGCQMNEHDSEIIAGMLENMGYECADREEDADFILFNTCCVREKPELKLYSKIGNLKRAKKENPDLLIAVSGCMAQQEGVRDTIKSKYSHVDLVFGTHNFHRLPELVEKVRATRDQQIEVWDDKEEVVEGLPVRRIDNLKALINIVYGCNNYCSYCIVPYVRGRERSRNPINIFDEVADLVDLGYKDITLLGQNVNSYGKDLDEPMDFAGLLKNIDEITSNVWLRFMTSHPKDCSSRLIDSMAALESVCEHFHLPLQAGSNKVLNLMNRKYTAEHYMDLIEEIRENIPGVSITTDLIVGFPGETEKDFEETLDIVKKVQFDSAFTFAYSPRPNTKAAELEDQVDSEEKRDRLMKLIDVQNQISTNKNKELEKKVLPVLVEGESKTNPHILSGRTRTNKIVVFEGSKEKLYGKEVPVQIVKSGAWTLHGQINKS